MDRAWLGLEIGTQGVRAAAFDDGGLRLSAGRARRPPRSPEPGAMVHFPELDWWDGTREALAGVLAGIEPGRIAGVGLAGLFPAVCIVASDGRALSEGVLYGDQRGQPGANEVAPRLMRLLRSLPEDVQRGSFALGPGGYLGLRLTGTPSIDPHSAAAWKGLIARPGRAWHPALSAALSIPPAMLPPIVPPGRPLGTVTEAAASATGLPAGIPVVAATTDSLATMLGAGALQAGDALANYASTGTLLLVTMDLERALADPAAEGATTPYRRVAHATGSGLLAELLRRGWLGGVAHATLDAEAASVPPGSEGVLVVPYLSGRVLPTPEPGLRASVSGIGVGHGRGHLWRAVLESFGWVVMTAQHASAPGPDGVRRVTAAGGGSQSDVWRGIVSDMTGWPQAVAPLDATVRGAAFLAAHSLSGSSFTELAERWPAGTVQATSAPRPAATEHYRTLLPAWMRLVAALVDAGEVVP